VELDLGDRIFEYAQFYVGLSRCRDLKGIRITALNFDKVMAHPEALEFYNNLSC
jgi:hypothetical protein